MYLMGIDGGGSSIRVVIITPDTNVLAEYLGPAVNPSAVGRDEAARRIQAAMRESIQQAQLAPEDRKSTRLNSSHVKISYAVFCLKKKKTIRSSATYSPATPATPG